MKLKSLELHGFKSFPDKTTINISDGMTVIVGPNGSGKSNISDAIKWVLGELSSKSIRGNKMEDIIFGGAAGRSPMSFAEVSIVLDNTGDNKIDSEFDEIKVTRRYYRSGESEYLLNNKIVRLKDIVELFMNTGIGKNGYSIVGQGKVAEILSQKSEERRIIFEEAAGISKYKVRKNDAEKRLAETDDNLVRVSDLVNEIGGRLPTLEKDAAKAKIYIDLFEQKKAVDIGIYVYDLEKIINNSKYIEEDYINSKIELDSVDELLKSYDDRIEHLNNITNENNNLFEQNNIKKQKLIEAKHTNESNLLVYKNDLSHFSNSLVEVNEQKKIVAGSIDKANKLISDLHIKLSDEEKNKDTLSINLKNINEELENIRNENADLSERINEEADKKNKINDNIINSKIRLSALGENSVSISEQKPQIESQINKNLEYKETNIKKKETILSTIDIYNSKITNIKNQIDNLTTQKKNISEDTSTISEKYNIILRDYSSSEERANTLKLMEEHFEGYLNSVKSVMEAYKNHIIDGIVGPVSKLISTSPDYNVAIETALGNNIQNVVVEDEKAAKDAIEYLKKTNSGRLTFYPVSSMKSNSFIFPNDLDKESGFIGKACELINFESRLNSIISSLLGRVAVFDNLNNATLSAKKHNYSFKIVTLDGQVINIGGSYTGGSAKHDSGILSRKHVIDSLSEKCFELKNQADELTKIINDNNIKIQSLDDEIASLNSESSLFSALINSENSSLEFTNQKLNEIDSTVASLTEELELLEKRSHDNSVEINKINEEFSESTKLLTDSEEKLSQLNNKLISNNSNINGLIDKKNALLVSLSIKGKDIDNLNDLIINTTKQINDLNNDLTSLNDKHSSISDNINKTKSSVSETQDSINKINIEIQEAEKQEKKLAAISSDYENEINELRSKSKEKSSERDTLLVRYTSLSSQMDSISTQKAQITDRLWEDYELSYSAAKELNKSPVTEETRSLKINEQTKLRRKIKELGSVNTGAIEEYTSTKERYDFFTKQIGDLNKSRKDIIEIIEKMEVEMRERFLKTFNDVNDNFGIVFSELFGGGTASLSLVDSENVLTSGIEINVAPPGKIIKNLKLLSGGEQAFVAIAIYFSILKVSPSPFCILDEIESALDEINVDRFAKYARQFMDQTQFIIITHRRGTMEEADTLYGITMQEKGISKVLSININEVERKTGVKL